MIHQCGKCGQEAILQGSLEQCATGGCPNFAPHVGRAIIMLKWGMAMGYSPVAPVPLPPGEIQTVADRPLYETTSVEKLAAGKTLKEVQSVMDAWEKLEKQGYTLARRTKPEVKK